MAIKNNIIHNTYPNYLKKNIEPMGMVITKNSMFGMQSLKSLKEVFFIKAKNIESNSISFKKQKKFNKFEKALRVIS